MGLIKYFVLLGVVGVLSSCATKRTECDISLRGTSEYRLCRAEHGSKEFQYRVGMEEFLLGNQESALKWFKRSAKFISNQKDVYIPPEGQRLFGQNLEFDNGDPIRGNEAAFFMLADIYDQGNGVRVDKRKAVDYKRRAINIEVDVIENDDHYVVKNRRILSRDENGKVTKDFELSLFTVNKKKEN